MRLALATWNGRISPVFDVARQLLVLDVDAGRVVARREEALPGTNPWAQAERLVALEPQVLICGAISQPMANVLAGANVQTIPFTAGDVEEVLAAWLSGSLPNSALIMPGCRGRMRRCRGRMGGMRGPGAWKCAHPRSNIERRSSEGGRK